ncbi:hypothetical protein D3C86_1780620 [compost metagenome]
MNIDNGVDPAIHLFRKGGMPEKIQSKQAGLFDAQEKEFDDKLKIACAVTTGIFSSVATFESYDDITDTVIKVSNSLYDKLKKQ